LKPGSYSKCTGYFLQIDVDVWVFKEKQNIFLNSLNKEKKEYQFLELPKYFAPTNI
jgi:hypothetical protein